MTPQEIFNTVALHLFAQKCRSASGPEGMMTCLYRGPNGTKCAVGALIPDELYNPDMEHNILQELMKFTEFELPSYFADNLNLLSDLQRNHDSRMNWTAPSILASKLRLVARSFKLSSKVTGTLRTHTELSSTQQRRAGSCITSQSGRSLRNKHQSL